jgi:hypothetical protein
MIEPGHPEGFFFQFHSLFVRLDPFTDLFQDAQPVKKVFVFGQINITHASRTEQALDFIFVAENRSRGNDIGGIEIIPAFSTGCFPSLIGLFASRTNQLAHMILSRRPGEPNIYFAGAFSMFIKSCILPLLYSTSQVPVIGLNVSTILIRLQYPFTCSVNEFPVF